MKNVLISGVAGFVGSHLAEKFLKNGFFVSGYDNFSTGKEENIQHLYNNHNFEMCQYDICKFMSNVKEFDYVVNLACPASPKDYDRMPVETLKVCSYGVHNLLGFAKYKGARFIQVSTSEVYGDPLVHPQSEDYWGSVNPIGLRSQYDEGKRFAEALTMAYNREGLNTGIARLFNSFGSRMKFDDGRAVPTFMHQAVNNMDITIYGDGTQTRSFTYIDDTVEGIYRLTMSDYRLPINIGSDEEVSLNELANEIIEITNSKSKIVYEPLPSDDPKQRRPEISRAKKILNWQPEWKRKDALIEMYKTINYVNI